jgi:adenine-specific DNA-methyltransferase
MTELNFKGKEFVYNHHLSVPIRPLEMHGDKGIGDPSLDGNLIIQGDNLHALKALLPMYVGKVDCIFIDPPYNTGNEGWAYNDNVNAPMIKEWLEANPIGIDDGLRHDKWCAMMWPRLKLLHELLAEDGSFWMTLDDNEAHRGKLLLDEIFGEDNFVGDVSWKHTAQSKNDEKHFSRNKNTLIVYRKSETCRPFRFERTEEDNKNYSNPDRDNKGPWRSGDVRSPSLRETLRYDLTTPSGKIITPPENGWRWSQEVLEEKLATREITFVDDETRILRKIYLRHQTGRTPENLWSGDRFGNTRGASRQLSDIFGDDPFETKKPIELIQRVMEAAALSDGIILDSFAGSGTTAHAVLEANKRDGGNRRFILVEMEDYADRLTAERVRRVINGYDFQGTQKTELLREKLSWSKIDKADKLRDQVAAIENLHSHEFDKIAKAVKDDHLVVTGEKKVANRAEGLGGSFTYCTLGDPIELDAILTGKSLPEWEALGRILFHMATSQPLDAGAVDKGRFYLGSHAGSQVWLIYKPDLDWLKSPEAALNLSFARTVAEGAPEDRHIVFAPTRHVSQKMLADQALPVEFAPLPFALYRLERE